MALNAGDLVILYSGIETRVIRSRLRALQFVARTYEAQLQRAKSVKVPTRNNAVRATSFARGGRWKNAGGVDVTLQDFTMRGTADGSGGIGDSYEVGDLIDEEDFLEAPMNVMAALADDQGRAMGEAMNSGIYLSAMHNGVGANGVLSGALAGTRGGANAAWVDDAGEIRTAGAGALDADFMIKNIRAYRSFFVNAKLMFVGEQNYETFIVMNPPLWYNLIDRVIDNKYFIPGLNFEAFSRGTLGADADGRVGMVDNIMLYIDPELKALTAANADDSANQHAMLGGAKGTDAWEFATRPPTVQFLTPQTNQDSPDYVMRSIRPQVGKLTQRGLMAKLQVRRTQNG